MNPSSLVDHMVSELTKEEKDYGYQYSESIIQKKAGDLTFIGKEAVTTYPGEEWTRTVVAYGWKDRGVLVITAIEKDNYEIEMHLINQLWKSIQIHEN